MITAVPEPRTILLIPFGILFSQYAKAALHPCAESLQLSALQMHLPACLSPPRQPNATAAGFFRGVRPSAAACPCSLRYDSERRLVDILGLA